MPTPAPKPRPDLKEACLTEALTIIEQEGVERLSLREVARRLGVSHQAPYRHFPSRDHILAEIVARAFDGFARHLDQHATSGDPDADMQAMGEAYLDYAATRPLHYRLMFATPLPDPASHPEMTARAHHAFDLLLTALRRKAEASGARVDPQAIRLDALFVWSALHGLATLRSTSILATLDLDHTLSARGGEHMLARFGPALAAPATRDGPAPEPAR